MHIPNAPEDLDVDEIVRALVDEVLATCTPEELQVLIDEVEQRLQRLN